jgi:hypothetical protein
MARSPKRSRAMRAQTAATPPSRIFSRAKLLRPRCSVDIFVAATTPRRRSLTVGRGVNDKLSPDDVERFQQAQGRAENVAYVPKKTPSNGPAPKTVNSTMSTLLTKEMDKQLGEQGLDTNGDASARTMTALNGLAAQYFGKSGNHVQAVTQAIADFRAQHGTGADLAGQAAGRTRQTASAQPTRPPAQGARQAPNGLWYVVRGKKPDGSPQYFRVDG